LESATNEFFILKLSRGSRILANGKLNAVGSNHSYAALSNSDKDYNVTLSVSPETCEQSGIMQLQVENGIPPYTLQVKRQEQDASYQWNVPSTIYKIEDLTAGVYGVSISDNSSNFVYFDRVIIDEQFIPAYNEHGALIPCYTSSCEELLELNDPILEGVYQAAIIARGEIIDNENVILKAGNHITLQPGFSVTQNGTLLAKIEDCAANNNNLSLANSTKLEDHKPASKKGKALVPATPLVLNLVPNPFKEQTIIEYYLEESSPIKLVLTDLQGRLIKVLAEYDLQAVGKQQYIFSRHQLASGIYIVSLQTAKEVISKKMVISE